MKYAFLILAMLFAQAASAQSSGDKPPPREIIVICDTGDTTICEYDREGNSTAKSGSCPGQCQETIEPLPPEDDEYPPTHDK